MATDQTEIKLTGAREQLQKQLERQQEKGGNCITLSEAECEELFGIMAEASIALDHWANGY